MKPNNINQTSLNLNNLAATQLNNYPSLSNLAATCISGQSNSKNIHGANTNSEKRKRNESTEERYLKRQKTINKVPVSYQNYF